MDPVAIGNQGDSLSIEKLADVLESVNYPVVILKEDRTISYINQAGEQLLGRAARTMIGDRAALALPEFFGKSFQHQYESTALRTATQYEEYFPPRDLWTEVHLCPSPVGILACVRDITSRKRTERILTGQKRVLELVTSGAKLQLILDAITSMVEHQSSRDLCTILLLSNDGKRLHLGSGGSVAPQYNAAIEGLEIGPAVGSCGTAAFTRRRVIASDISSDPNWAPYKHIALDHGLHACWSQPILSRDGTKVLGTIANYSRKAGEPSRQSLMLLATAAHLAQIAIEAEEAAAERASAQEWLKTAFDAAEKANRAKDRFLAMLSHELRTPLSPALLIATDLARDPKLSDQAREDMLLIQRSIELQTRLINDLLDLSRIENHKLTLELGPMSLHDLILDSLRICQADICGKNLQLATDLAATCDLVNGDPLRLRQVVCNLVKNGTKFTPEGGSIFVCTSDSPAGIRMTVRDTGIGADSATLEKMFEPFEQGGRMRESQGLGLGLTICKGLVEAHGGKIAAASDGPGLGLSIIVDLPCAVAAESGTGASPVESSCMGEEPMPQKSAI